MDDLIGCFDKDRDNHKYIQVNKKEKLQISRYSQLFMEL